MLYAFFLFVFVQKSFLTKIFSLFTEINLTTIVYLSCLWLTFFRHFWCFSHYVCSDAVIWTTWNWDRIYSIYSIWRSTIFFSKGLYKDNPFLELMDFEYCSRLILYEKIKFDEDMLNDICFTFLIIFFLFLHYSMHISFSITGTAEAQSRSRVSDGFSSLIRLV